MAADPEAAQKMDQVVEHLRRELGGLRTGRASLTLLDGLHVDYYGTSTPIRQVATLSTPEPRLITIQPWDPTLIPEIEKAILAANLGLTPTNDGKLIRLSVPPLTEERRREMVKLARKLGEEARVSIRGTRRDAIERIKAAQKKGELAEDESRLRQDEVQKLTDRTIQRVDEILKKKEAEILEV